MKKRTHTFGRRQRSREEIIADMKNLKHFRKVGKAKGWEQINIIMTWIFLKWYHCSDAWIGNFLGTMDSFFYQYDTGALSLEDMQKQVKEYCGVSVAYNEVDMKKVKEIAGGDGYLKAVGVWNREINNEILKDHSIQECCASLTLISYGWKPDAVYGFHRRLFNKISDVYADQRPMATENKFHDLKKYIYKNSGIRFENYEEVAE